MRRQRIAEAKAAGEISCAFAGMHNVGRVWFESEKQEWIAEVDLASAVHISRKEVLKWMRKKKKSTK